MSIKYYLVLYSTIDRNEFVLHFFMTAIDVMSNSYLIWSKCSMTSLGVNTFYSANIFFIIIYTHS